MPSVSVIIPVFNGARTLSTPLDCLFKQTLKDIEIIVVDDCSMDGSLAFAEDILRKENLPYSLLSQNCNKGVSAARNLGLTRAEGDCVLFLDADDYLEETCLEKLYSLFRSDGRVDAAFCGFGRVDPSGKILKPYRPGKRYLEGAVPGKEALALLWSEKIDIHMTSFMIRRTFLMDEGLKFHEGCIYREDFEFFSRVLFAAKGVASYPEELSKYVVYGDSTTGKKEFMNRAAIHELAVFLRLEKMLNSSTGQKELAPLIKKFILHGYIEVLSRLLKSGKRECFNRMVKSTTVRDRLKLARKKEIITSKPEYFLKLLRMYFLSCF
ncbi:MAG: glycosyltransferase family 2 protein [Aminivibrio sp.]|jgi:glycosyltransferase involved in cell wall biosynthesis